MEWEYGELMLEQGDIESLDNWSDDKEYVYSTMDENFDYMWREDSDGIHFIDRLYSCGIEDETTKERYELNELELHFKTIEEAKEWLDKKEKENK